ncbi:MAG: tRNA (guanosine(46)-N7)-methyltransferase TrmB [Planctomycetes bacterium]|nr:tRNA (guanosine(46)-N7)-methyltransferase TrmB [Planctomycetota bacterium]
MPLEDLQPYLLPLPVSPRPDAPPPCYDWAQVFGNSQPVEIEVGFGKGLFLLNAAAAHPGINFVGVEIERKYQLFAATRMAKRSLNNVRLACADARDFLRQRVADASVQTVHVYFPDPWWKKRHHKRRVFTEDFARQCMRILSVGGRLQVATDVEDYYQLITEVLAQVEGLCPLSPPEEHEPAHDFDYLTNFERKFRKKGKTIFRATYERGSGVRKDKGSSALTPDPW